ncbi:hypothetical protein QJS10_CPA08g01252 [Acorus calamus]|uniref:Uncharacterized protein n=1 Tax=Acorus calamus TaxID=4465 RepID=A0AAV9ECJ1_ACOCL|nr:hypothetical protein QJS10_CPA08g01252 [Acorus calamus]
MDPEMATTKEEVKVTIIKDIRRYYCEYCGICKSKKTLITSQVLSIHKRDRHVPVDTYADRLTDLYCPCDRVHVDTYLDSLTDFCCPSEEDFD